MLPVSVWLFFVAKLFANKNCFSLKTLVTFRRGSDLVFSLKNFTNSGISSFTVVSASLGPMASLMLPTQPPLRVQVQAG